MSCRAPFQPEEEYESLRLPNMVLGPGTAIAMNATHPPNPIEQQGHIFDYSTSLAFAPNNFSSGLGTGYVVPPPPASLSEFPAGFSQSKLSASASVFVPTHVGGGGNQATSSHHFHQQQPAGAMPYAQHGSERNGFKPRPNYNHYNQHNHHQPQQQTFNSDIRQLNNSVQNRLRISNQTPHNGAAGNYFAQQPMQQAPQHFTQQQPQSNAKYHRHPHLNNSFQSVDQHQYFQQQQQPQHPSSIAAPTSSSSSSHPDMETIALEYLDTVIHCLNQNPGQFDTIASRFLTIFDGMENNDYVLSIAMEDIFEKSIEQPNFRYMGAKLYNLLHMLNLKTDSLFHRLLKCKLEYHQSEVAKYIQSSEQQKVRETALFLAELYMQLRGDDDSRIQLIAMNIVYSLKQLLQYESSENVRCICQTLKLAGYDLSTDCPQDIKDIISNLKAIESHSPGKYPLAANVINLQQNNWGRKISNALGGDDPDDAATKPPEPPRLSDEPVFYGPDGHELTAEESDFLAAEDDIGSDGDDFDERDCDLDLDPEMDEETERAYKDFCKQDKNQRGKSS